MLQIELEDVFTEIGRRHQAMLALKEFFGQQTAIARSAEVLRRIIQPLRDRNDRWTRDADGSSRPGIAVDRDHLRRDVQRMLKSAFSAEAFEEALVLCTVNIRSRTRYFPVWQALNDLVHDQYRHTDRARHIHHYFDLLMLHDKGQLRTAVTDCDPLFRMYRDRQTGQARLGQLVDWRSRVDRHYYFLSVYGYEPEYVELGGGEFLYFDSIEIRD